MRIFPYRHREVQAKELEDDTSTKDPIETVRRFSYTDKPANDEKHPETDKNKSGK